MGDRELRNEIQAYARRPGQNLLIPPELRPYEYHVETMRTGEEVLADAELTLTDVHIEPRHLVRSSAYGNGDPLRLDPFHRATARLHWLRFADHTEDPDAIHSAIIQASNALREHGVPPEIGDAHSIDHRATEFRPWQVIVTMPVLAECDSWIERVEGVRYMLGALVAMPEKHPARKAVREYVRNLATPSVTENELWFFEEWVREQLMPEL